MSAQSFKAILDKHSAEPKEYEKLFRDFHRYPELSFLEKETASKIVSHLKSLSDAFDIRTGIGGTGLIAILKNGPGPTILLRADIDGLPIEEKTGLDYASKQTMKDTDMDDVVKPVMHACGHDFHITCNLGAAETLVKARDAWDGTIIFLFQPGEERGRGAQAMVDDGLFDPKKHACPIPDVFLGQHVFSIIRAGTVVTKCGPVLSAADNWRITVYGKGGHGSMPHLCIDPVVIAAHIVVRFQTLISRELPPEEAGVVTVGSLKAGETVNVISDEAVIQVNVRSVSEQYRKVILDGIKRIVRAECEASRSPKEPVFEFLDSYPLTVNDKDVTQRVQKNFSAYFGDNHFTSDKPASGSEDFQILSTSVGKPSMFWGWGGADPRVYDKHEKEGTLNEIPVNHSAYFSPAIHPTLKTGIDAMTVAALSFVGKVGQ
ncbi:hippurate hydrolase [Purpureocillium lavendulum]|uniref:Hippurate hydrolase n=1 Tax=Purpureocillium lavendulum TaxID=1247861 RepID=A0AB34FE03_9HYPO|nr:hippurate hydrolase [Purpureocillium lavendulum]